MSNVSRRVKMNISSLAIPAAVCVVICAFILTGITFSWFSSNVHASANAIKSGSFTANISVKAVTEGAPAGTFDGYSLTLPAGYEYEVTVTPTSKIDGWVEFALSTAEKGDVKIWQTARIGDDNDPNTTDIASQTIHFDTKTDEHESYTFKLTYCWADPGYTSLPTYDVTDPANTTVTVNDNTYDSTVSYAYYTQDMAALALTDVTVPFVVDPISGFLLDTTTGLYYNAEGAEVEPTTGFEYDADRNLIHPVTGRACSFNESGILFDVTLGWEIDTATGNFIHPITLKQCYYNAESVLVDAETALLIAFESGNLIDPATGFEIDPITTNLIHPVTLRLCTADEFGVVTDVITGWTVELETGYLIHPITNKTCCFDELDQLTDAATGTYIDFNTGWDLTADGAYLVHPLTLRTCYADELGILYDVETGWIVFAQTGYFAHPVSGKPCYYDADYNLIDAESSLEVSVLTGYFIDPVTGFEIDPVDEHLIHPLTGKACYLNDLGELIDVETNQLIDFATGELIPVEPEAPVILEGHYKIPDCDYQLNLTASTDELGFVHWQIYNPNGLSTIDLSPYAVDLIDELGFYIIPGSIFRIVPATGYIYDSVYCIYVNPYTGLVADANEALGILSDDPSDDESSDSETTEPSEPESTETTEPEVTEPETTEPETTEPESTEPETTESEVTEPADPEPGEPEAPAADPDAALPVTDGEEAQQSGDQPSEAESTADTAEPEASGTPAE